MKKQKTTQHSKVYFILLLVLGLVIIFESVSIINALKSKEKISQIPSVVQKIIPQTEIKKGTIEVILEENQKVIVGKDIKAKVVFDSPQEAVAGADVILTFDPKLISIVNIAESKEIFSQIIVNTQKQKEGKITITAYQPTKILSQKQVLAYLTVRVLQNQPATLTVEFLGPDVVTDSNLISQKTQKDLLGKVQSLNLIPESQ